MITHASTENALLSAGLELVKYCVDGKFVGVLFIVTMVHFSPAVGDQCVFGLQGSTESVTTVLQ